MLRTSLRHSLLEAVDRNLRAGADEIAIFEAGRIYQPRRGADGPLPDEREIVTGALCGVERDRWGSPLDRALDFFDAKGVIEELGERLAIAFEYAPHEEHGLLRGPLRARQRRRDRRRHARRGAPGHPRGVRRLAPGRALRAGPGVAPRCLARAPRRGAGAALPGRRAGSRAGRGRGRPGGGAAGADRAVAARRRGARLRRLPRRAGCPRARSRSPSRSATRRPTARSPARTPTASRRASSSASAASTARSSARRHGLLPVHLARRILAPDVLPRRALGRGGGRPRAGLNARNTRAVGEPMAEHTSAARHAVKPPLVAACVPLVPATRARAGGRTRYSARRVLAVGSGRGLWQHGRERGVPADALGRSVRLRVDHPLGHRLRAGRHDALHAAGRRAERAPRRRHGADRQRRPRRPVCPRRDRVDGHRRRPRFCLEPALLHVPGPHRARGAGHRMDHRLRLCFGHPGC